MPIELTFEDDGDRVVWVGRGVVTGAEIIERNAEVYAPDRPAVPRTQLVDFTGVERFEVSSDEVRRIAQQDRAAAMTHSGLRIGVAAREDLVYGLARMWEAYLDETRVDTRIFRTVDEARAWLDGGPGLGAYEPGPPDTETR